MQNLNVVEENNIYAAWEKDHREEIENYEYDKNEPRVTLKSTKWMNVVPPVLVLQMNRTYFKLGSNEKKHHKVTIESELKCQRFMYKNRD